MIVVALALGVALGLAGAWFVCFLVGNVATWPEPELRRLRDEVEAELRRRWEHG